jgi:hypothetical protein
MHLLNECTAGDHDTLHNSDCGPAAYVGAMLDRGIACFSLFLVVLFLVALFLVAQQAMVAVVMAWSLTLNYLTLPAAHRRSKVI